MRLKLWCLLLVLSSCVAFSVDAKRVQYVRDARYRAEHSNNDPKAVLLWGRELAGVLRAGTLKRGNLTNADVDDAVRALDGISGEDRVRAMAVKGEVLVAADRTDAAVEALEASLPDLSGLHYLLPILVKRGQREVAVEHCREIRSRIAPDKLMLFLSTCQRSVGLAWASAQDRTRLNQERAANAAAVQESADRRADERECQARIRAAEAAGDLRPSCRR